MPQRYIPHLAALFFALTAAALLLWGVASRREAAELRRQLGIRDEQLASANDSMKTMRPQQEFEELRIQAVRLARETTRLREDLSRVAEKLAAQPPDPQPEPVVHEPASTAGADAEADDAGEDAPGAAFAKMFSGKRGKKMAEFSARSAAEMQYGDFFRELDLPAEIEAQVREILHASMVEQITRGMEAMRGGADPEELRLTEKERVAELRLDLAELLTDEELAAWDEYEATKEERVMRMQFDMQLGMFAAGMTPENRTLATDVLVEEFLASKDALKETPQNTAASVNMQLAGMTRARERLAEQLDEKQLAHFDRFVDHLAGAMSMAAEMMGGQPDDADDEE